MQAIRGAMTALGTIAPPLAAEIAWRAFGYLGKPAAAHPRDAVTHAAAHRGELEVNGKRVTTYRWGDGPEVVLLVHGWRSRASRFGALVEALSSPERTILAFDAPGNGDSPGTGTTVLDYTAVITALHARHGSFEAIVGHSFGVLASFLAAREGVRVGRLVAVSGMYSADQLVDEFSRQLGLPPRAKAGLRRRIAERTFRAEPQPWRRFLAELEPTDTHIPVLLVHDTEDPVVDVGQAALIADAHTGPVTTLITSGLGHSRILSDPAVLDEIAGFLAIRTMARSAS